MTKDETIAEVVVVAGVGAVLLWLWWANQASGTPDVVEYSKCSGVSGWISA